MHIMARSFTKKQKTITIISVVAVVLVAALVVWWLAFQRSQAEPDPFITSSQTQDETQPPAPEADEPAEGTPASEDTTAPNIDPATVSTVDIEPLAITVSYVRGIPGFGFLVQRTPDGTQYVEFASEEVVGTKCTNDTGVFASIIVSPSDQDGATISKRVTLDGTVYGLSLPDATCTSDTELFAQYQASFKDAFSLLAKIEE